MAGGAAANWPSGPGDEARPAGSASRLVRRPRGRLYTSGVTSAPPQPAPPSAAVPHGRIAAQVEGAGPDVILVHGVGYGPATLSAAARAAAEAGVRVITPHRGGYGASAAAAPAADLDGQVADLIAVLDAAGAGRAVWAGVSGGATIALAAAIARPDRVAALVLHEPALGTLAGILNSRLKDAAAAVAASADAGEAALELARALGGGGWAGVDAATREEIRAAGPAVRAEIPMFPAFAPTARQLSRLRAMTVVSSVGARSGAERREAGDVLMRLAGAVPARPPSGHLVQLEAPTALAGMAVRLARPAAPHPPRPATAEEDA